MPDKIVLVIAYDETEPVNPTPVFLDMVDRVRPLFADKPGVILHAATRESARAVLDIFDKEA